LEHGRSGEEWVNALTHGIEAIAGAVGGAVLVSLAVRSGEFVQILGTSIYSASQVLPAFGI
jgi:predicted membrane channel-forming protein YqfA (hemolysin III family)